MLSVFFLCFQDRVFAGDGLDTQRVAISLVDREPALEDFLGMRPNAAWEGKLAAVEGFVQRQPTDRATPSQRTVANLGYDQKNIYVIFVCFDSQPSKIRARISRREDILDDDAVAVILDTFDDHRRAYAFRANAYGVQADAIWTEAQNNTNSQAVQNAGRTPGIPGLEGFDFSFDAVWDSKARLTPQGYVVWMAIPFRSLRFASSDVQTWGIQLNRNVTRTNEDVFWPHYSSRVAGRLNQEGEITGLQRLSSARNLQFIPYGSFASFRELDTRDPSRPTYSHRLAYGQLGLDAKAVLHDKFVLDATVNPDFSQVESDSPQITVSQRFEVIFPEKRPFFLENAGYFLTPFTLVFTRRIVGPKLGMRLTGKDGPWALGLLFADDASPGLIVPSGSPDAGKRAYFGIARINRDVGRQSTVGAIFTDREYNGGFNRIGGVDAYLRLNRNWNAVGQALVSSTRNADGTYVAGPAFDAELHRTGRQLSEDITYNGRATGFLTLPGFDPQAGVQNFFQHTQYMFRPEGRRLISWGPFFDANWTMDNQGRQLFRGYFPSIKAEFARQTNLLYTHASEGETLRPQDFSSVTQNISFSRHTNLFVFQSNFFSRVGLSVDYRSGTRVNYASAPGQAPFLARRNGTNTTLTVRPTHSLKVDNTYLWFRLRDRFSEAAVFNNHILRSSWNYQVTRALSFRFIAQYNAVLANPMLTNLTSAKNFNADFLVTYMPHPGTAVYVGYNSNLGNLVSPLGVDANGNLLRTPNHFINDGRHLFVKASYLFRF